MTTQRERFTAARDRVHSEREHGMVASRALDPDIALALLREVDAGQWMMSASTHATYRIDSDHARAAHQVVGEDHAALLVLHEARIVAMAEFTTLWVDGDDLCSGFALVVTAVTGRGFLADLAGGAS